MTQEALNHVVSGTLCGFVDYLSKHFFLPPKLDASQLITAFLVKIMLKLLRLWTSGRPGAAV